MNLEKIGFSLGEEKIKVSDLFSDARLIQKTGIEHVFATRQSSKNLARKAVENLGEFDKTELGACIVVTQSPDDYLPANAISLAAELGLPKDIIAFDVNQGCSGFVQAVATIEPLISKYKKILLVTVDRYRAKLSDSDRSTNAVFSDGASASLWSSLNKRMIVVEDHLTDGSKRNWLYQSVSEEGNHLHMSGAEVWMFTKSKVVPRLLQKLDEISVLGHSVGSIYLHQASKVVVDGIIGELPEKYQKNVPINYFKYGNTVSSTIPILIAENPMSAESGTVDVLCGFGVGLSCSIVGLLSV